MTNQLRRDPLALFRQSRAPCGIYARARWLGGDLSLAEDLKREVARLKRDQGRDGSWGGSMLATTRRLFGLHLTQRAPDRRVERGLDWLLARAREPSAADPVPRRAGDLRGLPFAASRGDAFWPPAALFLAAIFGREKQPQVMTGLERLQRRLAGEAGLGWAARNNIVRALVVHPAFRGGKGVESFAKDLRRAGAWPRGLPFYQAINALAHAPGPAAAACLRPAWPRLIAGQARDGWWGRADREFKSFLAVHAIKNAGLMA